MRRWIGVSTAVVVLAAVGAPASAADARPASPTRLEATNGVSSIALSWSQPGTGPRPVSFRVYENGAVVARNTTTRVTIPDLAFGSTHTYRVTAVDRGGRESAPSAPVTRQVFVGGAVPCGSIAPTDVTVTDLTPSAVSLAWSNAVPPYERPGTIVVLLDSTPVLRTTVDSARVGGLAPGATHRFEVAREDCHGQLNSSPPLTVTTPPGPAAPPGAPSGLTVGARTATSVTLSWSGAPGTIGYAVYEGGSRVATTSAPSVVLRGLWRDTDHSYTVAAVDPAGGESAHTAPVSATTAPCPDATVRPSVVNPPTQVTASALSASSVALSWAQDFEATSFTVYRLGTTARAVAVTRILSAIVTGLPSGDAASYAVVAHSATCGPSRLSAPASVTTPAGPAARPAAPAGFSVVSSTPNPDFTGTVTLAWSQPPGDDPPVRYRVYEGATVLATTTAPGVTLRLPGGPTHAVTVAAVNAAGHESPQSDPLTFTVPFLPPP
ncbi:fibronectin type III domain-containing protein [Actinomycetes bacterium KLBMP 9797]